MSLPVLLHGASGGGGGASSLDGLADVTLTAPADGDAQTYYTGTSKGVNAAPSSGTTLESVYRSANLSVSNNTTTLVTWDSEFVDDDGAHSTSSNTSRIVVPTGKTLARFTVVTSWAANNTGARYIFLEKNSAGTSTAANQVIYFGTTNNPAALDYGTVTFTTGWIGVTASDHYEVFVTQLSGGSLNLIGGTLPRASVFTAEFR